MSPRETAELEAARRALKCAEDMFPGLPWDEEATAAMILWVYRRGMEDAETLAAMRLITSDMPWDCWETEPEIVSEQLDDLERAERYNG